MPLHAAEGGADTRHLKQIPPTDTVRRAIRQQVAAAREEWLPGQPLSRDEMERRARAVLAALDLPEGFLGWTMVALASGFWHEQVCAVPHARRLLLLPHCLRKAEVCPARCDAEGLLCQDCGACDLTELRALGEQLGYRVLIAEGSPVVLQLILSGEVDAIVGVACLDALEKTLDKVLLAGIPCMAAPLLGNGCVDTIAETAWVRELIGAPHRPAAARHGSYLHLLRAAANLCRPERFTALLPAAPHRKESDGARFAELAGWTAELATDFLAAGGKYSRPFVTLAAYDAMTGRHGSASDGAAYLATLPDAVLRVALAMEVFHKASLVHDDIEDDDPYRYGRPTLHRQHGTAAAINAGDWLIGLGYRLVCSATETIGGEAVAEILSDLASAHTRLCEGQGAELAWRQAGRPPLSSLDVLRIYTLKTSPAFEAAILAGLRMAGPIDRWREPIARFSRQLGAAYQIVNDLEDQQAAGHNKRQSDTDLLAGRPTILLALAAEALPDHDRQRLEHLWSDEADPTKRRREADLLFRRAGVRRTAAQLVGKQRRRTLEIAAEIDDGNLRDLLVLLVDLILGRTETPAA